jgi:hypothetical protein
MSSSILAGKERLTKAVSQYEAYLVVDKKSDCCAMGVETGPLLLLSEGGFSELQITVK